MSWESAMSDEQIMRLTFLNEYARFQNQKGQKHYRSKYPADNNNENGWNSAEVSLSWLHAVLLDYI